MFDEKYYETLIRNLFSHNPKTSDGRIDYTNADTAAVLTIFIKYQDKILLLRRSKKVLTYKGKWNTVAGYLDEMVPIEKKVYEEIQEELNIEKHDISSIRIGSHFEFIDSLIQKTWIVFPVLVSLHRKPKITLDWEHTEYQWIDPGNIDSFDTVPNIATSFQYSENGTILPLK